MCRVWGAIEVGSVRLAPGLLSLLVTMQEPEAAAKRSFPPPSPQTPPTTYPRNPTGGQNEATQTKETPGLVKLFRIPGLDMPLALAPQEDFRRRVLRRKRYASVMVTMPYTGDRPVRVSGAPGMSTSSPSPFWLNFHSVTVEE